MAVALQDLIGHSPAMQRAFTQALRAAASDAPVLLLGGRGVGKRTLARAIHAAGARPSAPFVILSPSAVPDSHHAAALFGEETGDGTLPRRGLLEAADGGTLVLSYFDGPPDAIQERLLRAFQGRPFARVGGTTDRSVAVRVIPTDERRPDAIRGGLRRELFAYLSALTIAIPPLSARGEEEVIELAWRFLRGFSAESGRSYKGFRAAALEKLRRYHWPGNVRHLPNVIQRAVYLSHGPWIEVEDLALP
jgi:DNA-binding NtrC family response regulator